MPSRVRPITIGVVTFLVALAVGGHTARVNLHHELTALAREPSSPPPSGLKRYRGVIHVHSELSHDSRGTPEEIVHAAKAAGLDFVMTTDHNSPAVFQRGRDGLDDGVWLIRGAEFQVERDSVLALGIQSYINPQDMTFGEVTSAVAAQGGVAIGAHPSRFHHWDDSGLSGVEIWDLADAAKVDRWQYPDLVADVLRSDGGRDDDNLDETELLLSLLQHPARVLAAFDWETQRRHLVAIGAPDAHQKIEVFGQLQVTYPLTFGMVTTYLLAEDATRETLLDALRRGRTYVAFDRLARAATFDFRVVDNARIQGTMGDELIARPGLSLQIVSPHPGRITLLRDGAMIGTAEAASLSLPVDRPGTYRAEVALSIQGQWRPWIYSNPIYVR